MVLNIVIIDFTLWLVFVPSKDGGSGVVKVFVRHVAVGIHALFSFSFITKRFCNGVWFIISYFHGAIPNASAVDFFIFDCLFAIEA